MTPTQTPEQLRRTALIMWLVFLSTVGMFAFLLKQGLASGGLPPAPDMGLAPIFTGLAVMMGVGSLILRKVFPVPDTQKWFVRNVICWVMNESISLLGFVLGQQQHDFNVAIPYFATTVAFTLFMFPKLPD